MLEHAIHFWQVNAYDEPNQACPSGTTDQEFGERRSPSKWSAEIGARVSDMDEGHRKTVQQSLRSKSWPLPGDLCCCKRLHYDFEGLSLSRMQT